MVVYSLVYGLSRRGKLISGLFASCCFAGGAWLWWIGVQWLAEWLGHPEQMLLAGLFAVVLLLMMGPKALEMAVKEP